MNAQAALPTATDWVQAITGVLTLFAAVFAGLWARHAAQGTKRQADAAIEQVSVARAELELANAEAAAAREVVERQRLEAVRAERRQAEERIDALAPTVLARATPGIPAGPLTSTLLEVGRREAASGRMTWSRVDQALEVLEDEDVFFQLNVTIHLENVSDRMALVAVVDAAGGEVSLPSGHDTLVRPGAEETFTWTRRLHQRQLRSDEGRAEAAVLRLRLWVRDLALNAYDVVLFNSDVNFFTVDGSRLRVSPTPGFPWVVSLGRQLPERVYDRLDALELRNE